MKAIFSLFLALYCLHAVVLAEGADPAELQQLRKTYDDAVQRAVRPVSQAYLLELNRLRDTLARSGRAADSKQVDAEVALITQKLDAMAGAAPSTIGHRTVVLDSRATIPANSAGGYSLGAVRQGDVITLQYVSGLWKGHGGIASDNPDELNGKNDESRLVIARGANKGAPGEIIVMVPPRTAKTAFSFTFPTSREEVVLRIHKNSENPKNPGSVVYQVQVSR
ncbi:MAG TPA: hypothetical protein VGM54_07385 [Chthoniobacter sp.]|jgi:hypothetical protein